MNFYIDITLIPGPDIDHHFLLGKVYHHIHLGLVELQNGERKSPIGLAFPEYTVEKYQLGSKLRLFAPDRKILEDFNAKKRLCRFTDYVHITSLRNVPAKVAIFKRYKRKQTKASTERLARRKAKRAGIEYEEALNQLDGRKERFLLAPFINVSSNSSGHSFRLFIVEENCEEYHNEGFSCYGLSAKSSLPHF